ncbi:NUDIX hydrolase [Pseudomonas sp. NA-150]|uniref:NUDIX hydrolase n=1 Tax=Pseudomonas sp. NA-150 TaxID=3367525 RepID=UPI0037CB6B4F
MKARATVICRKDDRILYVRKPKSKWTLPGGKIEIGETPFEAAVRELEEETGLLADDLIFLARFEMGDTTHFVFITSVPDRGKPLPANEIAACTWRPCKRFRDMDSSPATKAIVGAFAGVKLPG